MRRIGLAVVLAFSFVLPPLAAGAQQRAKVPRIGILSSDAASTREEAFRQGLRDLGYVEGQNVAIESGRFEKLPGLATELVRLNVDVIVASPTEAIRPREPPRRSQLSWRSVVIRWAAASSRSLGIQA
jgi:putative ABC transport system substrate-binding protein